MDEVDLTVTNHSTFTAFGDYSRCSAPLITCTTTHLSSVISQQCADLPLSAPAVIDLAPSPKKLPVIVDFRVWGGFFFPPFRHRLFDLLFSNP